MHVWYVRLLVTTTNFDNSFELRLLPFIKKPQVFNLKNSSLKFSQTNYLKSVILSIVHGEN